MDLWQRARSFAEEAAKRSQEITREASRRSEVLKQGATKISQEFVLETAKRSKDLAAEASKKADLIKAEARKRADQIKMLADGITPQILSSVTSAESSSSSERAELEKFGITDELREFVKGLTTTTFREFPLQDEPKMAEAPAVSNVRQDLTQWQVRHATLVLSAIKEISLLRYTLCPRHLEERKFWRIYFTLVSSHLTLYEKKYNEEVSAKEIKRKQNIQVKANSLIAAENYILKEASMQGKVSSLPSTEQDLDAFLLGDIGSSDEGEDNEGDLDYDFDKILSSSEKA